MTDAPGLYSISGFATGTLEISEGLVQAISVTVPGYAPFTYLDSPGGGPELILFPTEHPQGIDGTFIFFFVSHPAYYSLGAHFVPLDEMASATGTIRLLTNHQLVTTGTFALTCIEPTGHCQVPVPVPQVGTGIGGALALALLVARAKKALAKS